MRPKLLIMLNGAVIISYRHPMLLHTQEVLVWEAEKQHQHSTLIVLSNTTLKPTTPANWEHAAHVCIQQAGAS